MSKRKPRSVVAIVIWTIVVVVILTPVVYVQVNKVIYANRVSQYLIGQEHYTREDIASVKGIWGIKLPPFFATVVFKDEPHVEYVYFAHNEVMQFSYHLTKEAQEKGLTLNKSELKRVVQQ